jgi:hypothetical protein
VIARRPGIAVLVLLTCGFGRCPIGCVYHEPFSASTIAPGSRLTVHERLVVPPGKWSVYFQRSVATSFGGIDEYAPHCELVLTGPEESDQLIEPGGFEVVEVQYDRDAALNRPVNIASSGQSVASVFDRHFVLYDTIMYLRSDEQPQVTGLRCAHLDEAGVGVFLTVAEIRAAIGSIMTLTLRNPQG